jgi:hypothetical protein
MLDSTNANCVVCGRGVEHAEKPCWEFGDNSHEAAEFFKARIQAQRPNQKPTWELVQQAFRSGYVMVNRAWIDHDGKGLKGMKK